MDAEEARQLDITLRRFGIRGVVAPEDPENLAGAWRVYDDVDPDLRQDITADALAAVARAQGPTRGFVIPRAS